MRRAGVHVGIDVLGRPLRALPRVHLVAALASSPEVLVTRPLCRCGHAFHTGKCEDGDCTCVLSCERCGAGDYPLCFNCFLQRPFQRDVECSGCQKLKSIVRYYLHGGWFCDTCRPATRSKAS